MNSHSKRIVITGAEGLVGTVLRNGLSGAYEIAPLTRTAQSFASIVGDVTNIDALVGGFAGAYAVIHLAAAASLHTQWEDVLNSNIVGTRNVFEAARLTGVKVVVLASSGHVLGLAEERAGADLYALDDDRMFDESRPVEPDSLYAVSKVFGETLGRFYSESSGVRVICVRLGTVLPGDDPRSAEGGNGRSAGLPLAERFARVRSKWLSHRDCCQIFAKAVEAESVRFAVVYGTSNNPRQIWSLASARRLLNYEPQDAAPAELSII